MSGLILVYIAAPYAALPDSLRPRKERRANTYRAAMLAQLATRLGWSPICVHPLIEAGVFGDDSNPVDRARGIAAVVAQVELVAQARGHLWVLTRDDGTLSAGCRHELEAFMLAGGSNVDIATWAEWSQRRVAAARVTSSVG